MNFQINHFKTGSLFAILFLIVAVISCNQDVTGSSYEGIQPTNQSTHVTSSASVITCRIGTFLNESGVCQPCSIGTYQDEEGQLECKRAEPGSFVSEEGAIEASRCSIGFFSNTFGATECTECSEGEMTDGEGATTCIIINDDPVTKEDCKKGGWDEYGFKNQGQCIRFVVTGKDIRINIF